MTAEQDTWTRVEVRASEGDAELAADLLWTHGAAGVEEREDDDGIAMIGGFADAGAAADALRAAAGRGWPTTQLAVTDDGVDAWRDFAAPIRAGRFLLVPDWLPAPPADGLTHLYLDPGRTFGSGSHPTSRLCISLIEGLDLAGRRVLDVGTGSGVLAVVAARCGAASVEAVDIDAESPDVVRSNAERNGASEAIRPSCASLDEVADREPPFDVVLANLLAPTIRELATGLSSLTRPGGTLIVSGLLEDRWTESVDLLPGFVVEQSLAEDGWVAAALIRDR